MPKPSREQIQESITLAQAKALQKKGDNAKVIELLKPLFDKQTESKTYTIDLLNVLGRAYEMQGCKNREQNKPALRIYNILYQHVLTAKPRNLLYIIDVLDSIMKCYADNTRTREFFTQESLKYADEYKQTGKTANHKEICNAIYYKIYFNAAIFHNDSANHELDSATRLALIEKATKCYVSALEYKPDNLMCLMHYARLVISSNIGKALKILLPFADRYNKDPNYNHAMWQIYSNINNTEREEEYKKRYEKSPKYETDPELIALYSDLRGTSTPDNDLPSEKIRVANKLYDEGRFAEVKKIIHAILDKHPNYVGALELAVGLEYNTNNNAEVIMELCDKILENDPKNIIALIKKADIYWQKGTPDTLQKANELYQKIFEQDYINPSIFSKLIKLNANNQQKLRNILQLAEKDQELFSPEMHLNIAHAYLQLGQYSKAHEAFNKARLTDKYYKHNQVALGIIYCLFQQASTKKDFDLCAKKLRSYFVRLEPGKRDPIDNDMLDQLKKHFNIPDVPLPAEKKEAAKPQDQNTDWIVPEEVKAKVKEYLQSKNAAIFDKLTDESSSAAADLERKSEPLFRIGGPDSHIYGYIASNTKFASEEEAEKFRKALASERHLQSSSKGIAGSKQLKNGRWAIKISDSDHRTLSTGIFFKPRADNPDQFDTIIRFGKVKTHARLNKK